MWDILRKIFCCHRYTNDKDYCKISDNLTQRECECESKGPPIFGTCDVCGAWTTY